MGQGFDVGGVDLLELLDVFEDGAELVGEGFDFFVGDLEAGEFGDVGYFGFSQFVSHGLGLSVVISGRLSVSLSGIIVITGSRVSGGGG